MPDARKTDKIRPLHFRFPFCSTKPPLRFHLLLTAFALAATLRAQSLDAPAVAATAERALERAYLRASETDLAAAQPLVVALAADPKNPALLYTRAFAHYAAAPALRRKKDNTTLRAELEKAVALLERVKGQPWEAEAAALHSGILGQLIGIRGGMAGMTLGPKSNRLMARAEKSLPANPRVLLFRGISLLNSPSAFGGDPVKGAQVLAQSVAEFAKADPALPGPHWGHADALTWLGIAKQKAGDAVGARAAWEQALALEPDYGLVKFTLLPSLAQKSAER